MKSYVFLFAIVLGFTLGTSTISWAEEKSNPEAKTDQKALVQGNKEFAFDLYRRLSKKEGNLIFSPSSISTALAMTYAGARGETAEQMAKVLHFTLPQKRLHAAQGALDRQVNGNQKTRQGYLHRANAFWGQQGSPFLADFLDLLKQEYQSELRFIDFASNPESARQTINAWVEKQTHNKIVDLLEPQDVNQRTHLVLANAAYFQQPWGIPFSKKETKEGTFHLSATQTIQVPMMHRHGQFGYVRGEGVQVLDLPYRDDRFSMLVVVPEKVQGLADLERSLTASTLARWVSKMHTHIGSITLPRFKGTTKWRLGKELSEMGMSLAFRAQADFSGMLGSKDLHLGEVVHMGHIHVDEQGTEAAAATAVVAPGVSSTYPAASFAANRPFLFLIRDNQTGSILFLGRVVHP